MKTPKTYTVVDLPPTEFYDRKWPNNGMHRFSNKIGGAFGLSKREHTQMIEARNRANRKKKEAAKALTKKR